MTNLNTRPVTISGTFGVMPFIGTDGKPDINALIGGQGLGVIVAGGGLPVEGNIHRIYIRIGYRDRNALGCIACDAHV